MSPPVVMGLLWLLFVASHLGVPASPLRAALIRRFGKRRYLLGYVVVAQVAFAVLPIYYASHRHEGPAAPTIAWARPLLIGAIVAGLALVGGGISPKQYLGSSPFASSVRPPYGLERITRHPIFFGLGLWAGAHALLATRLVGTVFFGCFAAFALVGTLHQEQKLLHEKGPDYQRYLDATSLLPFGAILGGRQSPVWREQPWLFLALGAGFAWVLRALHDRLLAWNGAGVALFFFAITTYFTVEGLRRMR